MSRNDWMFDEEFDPDLILDDAGRVVEYAGESLIGAADDVVKAFSPAISNVLGGLFSSLFGR